MDKVRWGVLSTSGFGLRSMVPALQKSRNAEVRAIASRDAKKAEEAARKAGIPRWYGSYEELLESKDIDAIYNPLPNHLHVPWTIAAMKAGKHVLCEKPVSLTAADVRAMIKVRDRMKVKAGEAFMVRTNPQWLKARDIVKSGGIGGIVSVTGHFSYFNDDPGNIRNRLEWGGGAMWDIGCYTVTTSRMVLGEEPERVVCVMEKDPRSGTDILSSAILDFPSCQAAFTVATRQASYQRMQFLGTERRLDVEVPFNAQSDRPNRLFLWNSGISAEPAEVIEFPVSDQYVIQSEAFSRAILDDTDVAVPLEDSLKNTAVLEALFKSARKWKWVSV